MADEKPYFETALYHQAIDGRFQVYYTVDNAPTAVGGPKIRTFAWGRMKYETRRTTDGALVRTVSTEFQIPGKYYQMAAYPPDGVEVSVQGERPPLPTPPAQCKNIEIGHTFDGVVIIDEVSGAAAIAAYDPSWGAQPSI